MRYSLLTRFRGCWLGALLGGIYSFDTSGQMVRGYMAVAGAESLIKLGRFEPEDWYMRFSGNPNLGTKDSFIEEALIASIPVALFYHEDEIKLRQNLLALVKIWSAELVGQDEVLAVGYTLSQSLKEKIHPATLIPQIISFLGTPSRMAQDLARVQTYLEQGSGLEIVATEFQQPEMLQRSRVALALYCFLSTAEDYRLSILRAARIDARQITATLTGAISGAHNGTVGIPASSLQIVLSRSETALAAWSMDITQMLELADRLLAVWSGVYSQSQGASGLTQIAAIAAPKVMRLP